MRNIFKRLIPKEDVQEVTELESWTLRWEIQGDMYGSTKVFHKSFIKKDDVDEYEKQLNECAKFIGAWVNTKITRN